MHKPAQTGTNRHTPAQTGTNWHKPAQTGTYWHRQAQTGTNRHKPAQTSTNRHKPAQTSTSRHKPAKFLCHRRGEAHLPPSLLVPATIVSPVGRIPTGTNQHKPAQFLCHGRGEAHLPPFHCLLLQPAASAHLRGGAGDHGTSAGWRCEEWGASGDGALPRGERGCLRAPSPL